MSIVTYLTLCFIAFELLKLTMLPTYYRVSITATKRLPLVTIEFFYLMYLIGLLFTHYWYVGICVIAVSLITAFQLMGHVTEKRDYDKSAKSYLSTDSLVSVILMLIIIAKELKP